MPSIVLELYVAFPTSRRRACSGATGPSSTPDYTRSRYCCYSRRSRTTQARYDVPYQWNRSRLPTLVTSVLPARPTQVARPRPSRSSSNLLPDFGPEKMTALPQAIAEVCRAYDGCGLQVDGVISASPAPAPEQVLLFLQLPPPAAPASAPGSTQSPPASRPTG